MSKKDAPFVLCRLDSPRKGNYGGEFFLYKDKDTMIATANKMVTELGFDIDDIMMFETGDQWGKHISTKLEVHI